MKTKYERVYEPQNRGWCMLSNYLHMMCGHCEGVPSSLHPNTRLRFTPAIKQEQRKTKTTHMHTVRELSIHLIIRIIIKEITSHQTKFKFKYKTTTQARVKNIYNKTFKGKK
jgi:hypothetical protein